MIRVFALSLVVLFGGVSAARSQMAFDSNVAYVNYQVAVKADCKTQDHGVTNTWKYDSVWETAVKLDVRSQGQVLSMLTGNQFDPAKMQNMSPAEQLKMSQQMLDAMQYAANWIQGAPEGVDGGDAMLAHMKAVSVPVRISYTRTTEGSDLVDEMGTHYDMWSQTTLTYAGSGYTDPNQVKFEMNSASKKHWLMLPFNFQDMQNQGNVLKWVTVSKHRAHGATAWESDEPHTDETLLDALGQSFRFDKIANGQDIPIIEGTTDAAGKVSGSVSYPGHMDRLQPDVPVTLTYRYTVTTTPPAKAAGGK